MKSKFNNLLKYIYDYSENTKRKETVNSLFCSILEPLIQNQKAEAYVFLRILDKKDKETSIKRLSFSGVKIYNFGKDVLGIGLEDNQIENIWENTEFLVVLGGRYSAALIWDYNDSANTGETRTCLLYNSRIILDIAKLISDNSKADLNEFLKKYMPDRRENRLMNSSIQKIVNLLNDRNEELIFSEYEKNSLKTSEDTIKTAQIITEKAKFIAHEIKNHLSIINLYSQIANKRFETVTGEVEIIQSIKNSLKNIMNASENISYLIGDLRCMSTPYKKNYNLKDLIKSAIDMCKLKAEKSNVKIHIKDIEEIIVNTDKTTVQCAITNIIFNAIDANAKNITVEITDKSILIKNDGDEIKEEIKDKIFEENFTTKEYGNGLGLSFCKKQLQSANGDIKLISSNNKETVFLILIQ